MSFATFLRVHSNSKEVSYLSWQNTCPNLKTNCHIKLKFCLWTKLVENLIPAKYLISVAAPLKFRSSRSHIFFKIGTLKNFANWKIHRKIPVLESFNKVTKHRCFPVNFGKFLRTFFYRPPLVAGSENLRDAFVQQFFSLQLKLCLNLNYFHSYSFATGISQISSNIFLMFH